MTLQEARKYFDKAIELTGLEPPYLMNLNENASEAEIQEAFHNDIAWYKGYANDINISV